MELIMVCRDKNGGIWVIKEASEKDAMRTLSDTLNVEVDSCRVIPIPSGKPVYLRVSERYLRGVNRSFLGEGMILFN